MLGQGAPARTEDALADLSSDLDAIFGPDPEGAIGRVIDRIGASLAGDTSSWLDSRTHPRRTGRTGLGKPGLRGRAGDPRAGGGRAARLHARAPDRPRPEPREGPGLAPAARREARGRVAGPDPPRRPSGPTSPLSLAVPENLKDRFPEDQRHRLNRSQVRKAMTNATYSRTLARAVGEIAMLADGKTPPPWVEWQHPLKVIGGGQDEDPAPLALGHRDRLVLLFLVSFFLYMLVTNPKAVLLWIGVNLAEAVIGGLFGGGGSSSSGGGFSGGGGSFGGGGASGSW
jgi:hypothetical protein